VRIQWQDELLGMYVASGKVASAETAFKIVAEAARSIGFDHCSYEAKLPLPLAEPRFLLLDTFDEGLRDEYRHSRRRMKSWDGSDVDIFDWPVTRNVSGDRAPQKVLFNALTVQLHANAGCLAYFTVLVHAKQRLRQPIRLLCLAHLAHCQIYRHLEESSRRKVEALSPRELDVIAWSADGKTSSEMATLLGVSENTVKFHFKNAKEKLGSSSKASSVVKAALLGMLSPRTACRALWVPSPAADGLGRVLL
jgi:LuxR family transcriptional regulator, quorum-sensing system regulator SolR